MGLGLIWGMVAVAVFGAVADSPRACEQPAAQVVEMVGGTWDLTGGDLVSVSVVADGLAWSTVDGATVTSVLAEGGIVASEDAMVSAAVALPGAPTGVVPILHESEMVVTFQGAVSCVPGDDLTLEMAPLETDTHQSHVDDIAPPPPAAPVVSTGDEPGRRTWNKASWRRAGISGHQPAG